MHASIYSRQQLQHWEQRWFAQGNSSFGLMQQAAWQSYLAVIEESACSLAQPDACITVWCGSGNNGGDGWLLAYYLKQAGHTVQVFELAEPATIDSQLAKAMAQRADITIYQVLSQLAKTAIDIDALFGIGLNRPFLDAMVPVIEQFNRRCSYKVALDIPSGLDADTGTVVGIATKVDLTLTVLGLKAGLFTGQGKAYAGKVRCLSLLAPDAPLQQTAILITTPPQLPPRLPTGHKGHHGHVLVVGGDETMGGAAIMAAEAALACGAGKVTLLTHVKHHSAALTRCPNVMTLAMPSCAELTSEWAEKISHDMDCVVIGMGLGRTIWGQTVWQAFLPVLESQQQAVVVDADGLWHLANEKNLQPLRHQHWYLTPHTGEAARLLGISADDVEQDRIAAIHTLRHNYGGNWLLKGAGSLTLDEQGLAICALGNAGMATAGMGDILAGMTGGLLAQLPDLRLQDIVALHASAGDLLAQTGERGLQAPRMIDVLQQMVN